MEHRTPPNVSENSRQGCDHQAGTVKVWPYDWPPGACPQVATETSPPEMSMTPASTCCIPPTRSMSKAKAMIALLIILCPSHISLFGHLHRRESISTGARTRRDAPTGSIKPHWWSHCSTRFVQTQTHHRGMRTVPVATTKRAPENHGARARI